MQPCVASQATKVDVFAGFYFLSMVILQIILAFGDFGCEIESLLFSQLCASVGNKLMEKGL